MSIRFTTKFVGALAFVAMIVIALADDTVTIGGKNKFIQPNALVIINPQGTPALVSASNPIPVVILTPSPTATATATSTNTPTPTP
jgi:hypothetical protein